MINISIKDVPDDVAERLRRRAERNHRSLQGELMSIIEAAAAEVGRDAAAVLGLQASRGLPTSEAGGTGGRVVQGWRTVADLVAERRATGTAPRPEQAQLPRAVDIVRAARDAR